jgi:hypothetical protein
MTPGILAADKTMYIEELDKSREYQYMFLRPRRWGKSTFLQMLADYYDKNKAAQFDDTFSQLYIGKHPTPCRSSLLVLLFDFSSIRTYEQLNESFNNTLNRTLRVFLKDNAKFLGYPDPGAVIQVQAVESLEAVLVGASFAAQLVFLTLFLTGPSKGAQRVALRRSRRI